MGRDKEERGEIRGEWREWREKERGEGWREKEK